MSEGPMTQDEAVKILLSFIFSGAIGPSKGRGVGYALLQETPTSFSWSAALEDLDGSPAPIDRYCVQIDRQSREILAVRPIQLTEAELSEAVLSATGRHLQAATRFTDGALSISYKVTVQEAADTAYVIQLRHHGNVASMDSLMTLISRTIDRDLLPIPAVYPIPGELERQHTTGMGRQITKLVPGIMAEAIYPQLPHEQKLAFVRRLALAFQACWSITLPKPPLIGELVATTIGSDIVLSVGPDRHYSLGGPFTSVRDYLDAYIKSALIALEKQQGIDEFKDKYLERIRQFVKRCIHNIPTSVENVPIVALHSDMGLHNIIVSEQASPRIEAIIDWEFVASAPFASVYLVLEMLFRKTAENGFGQEYDRAHELRDAFWGEIPEWKQQYESDSTQEFLEWFRFGLFMKPEWRPADLPEEEAREYWHENIRVVESMLSKYPSVNG